MLVVNRRDDRAYVFLMEVLAQGKESSMVETLGVQRDWD
jgi:hypothetical protein